MSAIVTRSLSTALPPDRAATVEPRPRRAPPPLRILTFLYSFAPGGVERVAARLHAAWRTDGVDARIVLADASVAPPPVALDGIGEVAHPARGRGLRRFVALVRGARAAVIAQRPHVLFCAGNTYTSVAVVLKLLLGPACPPIVAKISNCLVRPDMSPPLRWFYRRWLRIQGRHIDQFVGMAAPMRDEIARCIGVSPSQVSVIEDPALSAADLTRLAAARDAAARDHAGRRYLAIGRLAAQKNLTMLVEAFARIAAPHDTLTILGEGPERATLERRAAELGVRDALQMPGHIDPLDPWLAQADVFVMSSDYEGVPAALIEALAAGVPIVATDCCVSMGDLLGHGALGRLVPVGDVAALADAMASRNTDAVGTVAARRAAVTRFTVEHATERYLMLMRDLATARDARSLAPQREPIRALS